jgi:hypothetical protein
LKCPDIGMHYIYGSTVNSLIYRMSKSKLALLDKPTNYLYILEILMNEMSYTRQLLTERSDIPKVAIGVLVAIMLFGLFVSGFDQGQLFSLVEGKEAFDNKWLHEFVHDMRHASGFPCH